MVPTDRDLTADKTTTATLDAPVAAKSDTQRRECPECGNTKTARARRHGVDRVISLVNIYPYSCRIHTCKARFYRFGNTDK
jgi:predicted RNA-binding Zn-ribbon protein involved in translation (DUF1610 family)